MQLEDYFDFLGADDIRLKGLRIGIEQILGHYLEGVSPEQIAQDLPGLTLEEIHATITYYWHNKAAVDVYLKRVTDLDEAEYQDWASKPSPTVQRLRALRAAHEQRSA
ncbi:MAG: DUF433 domain-containing protein [Chloroflexota bacterium]|nr:MAG: DUF433 domain-containing protein [Chloroflexota bacterium]